MNDAAIADHIPELNDESDVFTAVDRPPVFSPNAVFAKALADVESHDSFRRQRGIGSLERLGDARSLRVIGALRNDADHLVAKSASTALRKLEKKALQQQTGLFFAPQQKKTRREQLSGRLDILDEVLLLVHRTYSSILWIGFVTGFVKIMLAAFCLAWLSVAPATGLFLTISGALLLVHYILVRPVAIGVQTQTLLRGFVDREARMLADRNLSPDDHQTLIRGNFIELAPLVALFIYIIFAVPYPGIIWVPLFILCFFLYAIAYSMFMPLLVIERKPVWSTFCRAVSLTWEHRGMFYSFSLMLVGILVAGYFVIWLPFFGLFQFFALDRSWTIAIVCFILADAVLDPFVTAFRLLITRLLLSGGVR